MSANINIFQLFVAGDRTRICVTMYPVLHDFLMMLYLVLPPLALGRCLWRAKKKPEQRYEFIISFLVLIVCSFVLAGAVLVIYRTALKERVLLSQIGSLGYFFIGFLLILRGLRWVAAECTCRLMFVPKRKNGDRIKSSVRYLLAQVMQAALAVLIGLPIIFGTLLTLRLQTGSSDDAKVFVNRDFRRISFQSTDRINIRGWWIEHTDASENENSANDTVIICLSSGDDLQHMASLIQAVSKERHNVLVINLRCAGGSDGRWTGFGESERMDILAAIKWLHQNHPEHSRKLHLIGGGIGGAAAIAAAADDSPEARAIESIVLINTYSSFKAVVDSFFDKPGNDVAVTWLKSLTLPVMSAHAGSDLLNYSEGAQLQKVWPTSVLIIHSTENAVVSVNESYNLLHAASYPKKSLWIPGGHLSAYEDKELIRTIVDFLKTARKKSTI